MGLPTRAQCVQGRGRRVEAGRLGGAGHFTEYHGALVHIEGDGFPQAAA